MKQYILAGALASVLASPAYAGPTITVNGYSTPDALGFNSVTTAVVGVSDTPYSYYTGPINFSVVGQADPMTVYCADLNHWLQTGVYEIVDLKFNGMGQPISEFDSNRIGHLAAFGALASTKPDFVDQAYAVAAQAAIWQIAYDQNIETFIAGDNTINTLIFTLLNETFLDTGYAQALLPVGWTPTNGASQLMVIGSGSPVPEPSTWAMGITGFAFLAGMGWRKRKLVTA